MGIDKVIKRNLVQIAVYWGNPQDNRYGGFTYDAPIEVACRWEDMPQVMLDKEGEQDLSRAVVYLCIDVDTNGLLYLGRLTDIQGSGGIDFNNIQGIHQIRRWRKVPALGSNTIFLRKAFLTPYLT